MACKIMQMCYDSKMVKMFWNTLGQLVRVDLYRPLLLSVRYKSGKSLGKQGASHRQPSLCNVIQSRPDPKPCFSMDNISIELGNLCHAKLVRSFIYTHHWPREPSVTSLWMSLNSNYLCLLTEKYAYSGDRFLAFERQSRTGERKLVGVLCANMTFPWMAEELEEWAQCSSYVPDRHRMYFQAHCLRSPNLFKKYNCGYIYEVEVLTTASEVTGHGVATLLLKTALESAKELRHPLTQLVATNSYVDKICGRCGMQQEWTMKYKDFVDETGHSVFYPRHPHTSVSIYVKPFDCAYGSSQPCLPPYL